MLLKRLEKTDWYRFQWQTCQRSAGLRIVQSEDGGIEVWDTKAYTLLHIMCSYISENEFSFNGKRVNNFLRTGSLADNLYLSTDFYGLDAKGCLSVNREEFKAEKKNEILRQIDAIISDVVDFLLTLDDISKWLRAREDFPSHTADCYWLLWQIAEDDQKKLIMADPQKYLEPMNMKAQTFCWSGSEYKESETSMGKIIENYRGFSFLYCPFAISLKPWKKHHLEEERACCFEAANAIAEEVSFQEIVLDSDYIDLHIPGANISRLWLFPESEGILVYSLDNRPPECFEMSGKSKARYLKSLYYGQNFGSNSDIPRRYAIPALQRVFRTFIKRR